MFIYRVASLSLDIETHEMFYLRYLPQDKITFSTYFVGFGQFLAILWLN